MSETLHADTRPLNAAPVVADMTNEQIARFETQFGNESKRAHLLEQLIEKELITPEFAASDVLDKFSTSNSSDSLRNILLGGKTSKPHHFPTIAKIHSKSIKKQGLEQWLEPTEGRTFQVDEVQTNTKYEDVAFFPNEWTVQQLAENIVHVAEGEPVDYDKVRQIYTYESNVDGVGVRVFTYKDGNIRSAEPILDDSVAKRQSAEVNKQKIGKQAKNKAKKFENQTPIETKHQRLIQKLVENGLITTELASSEMVERFASGKGASSLEHILVGDERGGAHHLPTIMNMDNQSTIVASQIYDPKKKASRETQLFNARLNQGVLTNGVYKAKDVEVKRGRKMFRKFGGSHFFPNDWTTERVIKNIVQVADTEPIEYDELRKKYVYKASVEGVMTKVITNSDNKIITAYPIEAAGEDA